MENNNFSVQELDDLKRLGPMDYEKAVRLYSNPPREDKDDNEANVQVWINNIKELGNQYFEEIGLYD